MTTTMLTPTATSITTDHPLSLADISPHYTSAPLAAATLATELSTRKGALARTQERIAELMQQRQAHEVPIRWEKTAVDARMATLLGCEENSRPILKRRITELMAKLGTHGQEEITQLKAESQVLSNWILTLEKHGVCFTTWRRFTDLGFLRSSRVQPDLGLVPLYGLFGFDKKESKYTIVSPRTQPLRLYSEPFPELAEIWGSVLGRTTLQDLAPPEECAALEKADQTVREIVRTAEFAGLVPSRIKKQLEGWKTTFGHGNVGMLAEVNQWGSRLEVGGDPVVFGRLVLGDQPSVMVKSSDAVYFKLDEFDTTPAERFALEFTEDPLKAS